VTYVPILRQGRILIASVRTALSDRDILLLQDRLLGEVTAHPTTGVVIDVSVLDVLDSFATRTLRDIARSVRLRGAKTVIVGIQPEVAFSMVLLGLTLEDISSALDLDAGLDLLRHQPPASHA
jgi:rsbT antagonist protein RsbS